MAISPILPKKSSKLIKAKKLALEILYDEDNQFARELDLVHGFDEALKRVYRDFKLDVEASNGNDKWELPIPARIVVDSKQVIQSIDANPDYTIRPEPEETLQVVKGLGEQ